MSKSDLKDTAELTDCSTKSASRAAHDARDKAASMGLLDERNENKCSDSPEGGILHAIFKALGMIPKDDE